MLESRSSATTIFRIQPGPVRACVQLPIRTRSVAKAKISRMQPNYWIIRPGPNSSTSHSRGYTLGDDFAPCSLRGPSQNPQTRNCQEVESLLCADIATSLRDPFLHDAVGRWSSPAGLLLPAHARPFHKTDAHPCKVEVTRSRKVMAPTRSRRSNNLRQVRIEAFRVGQRRFGRVTARQCVAL
jgi:hypothetical protein